MSGLKLLKLESYKQLSSNYYRNQKHLKPTALLKMQNNFFIILDKP